MTDTLGQRWETILECARSVEPCHFLAAHARIAREISQLRQAKQLPKDIVPVRIVLLRSAIVEPMVPSLVAELAVRGFAAEAILGPLGSIVPEILHPRSLLNRDTFDLCLVLPITELVLPSVFDPASEQDVRRRALDNYLRALEQLSQTFAGHIIVCNFAPPDMLLMPNYQAQNPGSGRYFVARANEEIALLASCRSNVSVCDLDMLTRRLGSQRFWSRRDMASSMQPLTPDAMLALARQIADICCLVFHRAMVKCIVLDCDNTLWGGVLGEEQGSDRIHLGEAYPGICYLQFQKQLSQLKELGYLLALNSKNNDADVRQLFENHPSMALKYNDFAAVRVNWNDKASNMVSIAEELKLGLDSFLFLDDSEFEVNLMCERLPQVRCLKVPDEPWQLPGLLASRILDCLHVTPEDRAKTHMYTHESRRKEFYHKAGSLEDFLKGLGMVLRFEPFKEQEHLRRAAQLTQKTNQFNLTTRRYTEPELLAAHKQGALIFLGSLQDRFGDYGRIILAIVMPRDNRKACLDTFLMSCRAIGRGVESVFLKLILNRLHELGYLELIAEYMPNSKNALCDGFLERNGFTNAEKTFEGGAICRFDLQLLADIDECWIDVEGMEANSQHG
jgi:FkbH-like protein